MIVMHACALIELYIRKSRLAPLFNLLFISFWACTEGRETSATASAAQNAASTCRVMIQLTAHTTTVAPLALNCEISLAPVAKSTTISKPAANNHAVTAREDGKIECAPWNALFCVHSIKKPHQFNSKMIRVPTGALSINSFQHQSKTFSSTTPHACRYNIKINYHCNL